MKGRKAMEYPARLIPETMREQSMREHSENVAEICAEKMAPIGLESLGRLTGLIHDAGKLSEDFVQYLRQNDKNLRGSVNHSDAAAEYIYHTFYKTGADAWERLTAQLVIDSVYCHHGRLFDCITAEYKNNFEDKMKKHSDCGYAEKMSVFFREVSSEKEITALFRKSCAEIKAIWNKISPFKSFGTAMLQRLLYSALIDADRYDAFCFEAGIAPSAAGKPVNWEIAAESMERLMDGFKPAKTEINKVRNMISEKCLDAANRGDGIYTLSVPTGSGKTLASLRFALNLAKKSNKKHIIYAVPYTTILDQTAAEVREICGGETVLVHHSGIVKEDGEENAAYRLLTQRWDSPVILTTTVQLMNAIYCGKSASARRMSALCDSVVIVDEAQSVPRRLVCLFTEAVNFLHEVCKTTVLLCTATQPDFCLLKSHPLRFSDNRELAAGIPRLKEIFKRNEVENLYTPQGMSLEEIAALAEKQLETENSVLVIMNKVGEARKIYELISRDCEKIYLSSKKCGAHRKLLIDRIKKRTAELAAADTEAAKKLIVVSTQLVEAGVDFSFGCVIRAAAGTDSLVQAAGRCNRNGEIGRLCKVYTVNVANEDLSMLKDIQFSKRCTEAVISRNKDIDLLSEEAVSKYYAEYFKADGSSLDEMEYVVKKYKTTIMDMLSANSVFVRNYRGVNGNAERPPLCQAFETAGKEFKVIDDASRTVLVPYGKGKEYIEVLNGTASLREKYDVIRKCGEYGVNLYPYETARLADAIFLIEDVGVYALSDGNYSEEYGLETDLPREPYIS